MLNSTTSDGASMIPADDARVQALQVLITSGDTDGLSMLLAEHPTLATERFGDHTSSRTSLHVATDWPGHFPNVAGAIVTLIGAGAQVDARFAGPHVETPLHWAASSNDVAALDALLDAGANIESDGALLTSGTALADAVVFAQWDAARRLVARGAVMTIWQAAALGEITTLERLLERLLELAQSLTDITNACWHACRAGQIGATQLLAARGADLNWMGYDNLTVTAAGLASGNAALVEWLTTP
jgi:uncharacterized protein